MRREMDGTAGHLEARVGNQPGSFALPTIDPGEDVGAFHTRQIVVLEPGT